MGAFFDQNAVKFGNCESDSLVSVFLDNFESSPLSKLPQCNRLRAGRLLAALVGEKPHIKTTDGP
jgi:hypothetical protein